MTPKRSKAVSLVVAGLGSAGRVDVRLPSDVGITRSKADPLGVVCENCLSTLLGGRRLPGPLR